MSHILFASANIFNCCPFYYQTINQLKCKRSPIDYHEKTAAAAAAEQRPEKKQNKQMNKQAVFVFYSIKMCIIVSRIRNHGQCNNRGIVGSILIHAIIISFCLIICSNTFIAVRAAIAWSNIQNSIWKRKLSRGFYKTDVN